MSRLDEVVEMRWNGSDREKSRRSSISDKFGEMATATKRTQTGGHGFSAVVVAKIPCLAHFIYPGR